MTESPMAHRRHLILKDESSDERIQRREPRGLFSDLGQWLLKVLLASRLPADLLAAPREGFASAAALARMARVSNQTASRLASRLRAEGFLEELQIVRLDDLLRCWAMANARPVREIRAQWPRPPGDPRVRLYSALRRPRRGLQPYGRIALALHSAAAVHRCRFVFGAPNHLYVEQRPEALCDAFDLVPVGPNERADVFLRIPPYPNASFRAAVVRDGLPVTDILQCWLDVQHHPACGREQALHIFKRVLEPKLLRAESGASVRE